MHQESSVWDTIDMKLLQRIQDNWSRAMGFGFVTVDYKGIPVTTYSGFTHHCLLGRTMPGFAEMCEQCDAHGGLHAAITGQPYIYRCHAGLVDFSLPLIVDGSFVGAVLGGQVRLCEEEANELERILPQEANWHRFPELKEAYDQTNLVEYSKIEAAVVVIRDMILYMIQNKHSPDATKALEAKEKELASERMARATLEATLQQQENISLQQQTDSRYFYFVMNIISRLAAEDGATRAENVCYDFTDIMRYSAQTDQKVSTLGEEIGFVSSLLRIQKAWQGDALSFNISISQRYNEVACPYMVLQGIVEACLLGIGRIDGNARKIDVLVEEVADDVLVQVFTQGEKMGLEDIEALLNEVNDGKCASIVQADRNLKRMFGKRYGISVNEQSGQEDVVAIAFRLPRQQSEQ